MGPVDFTLTHISMIMNGLYNAELFCCKFARMNFILNHKRMFSIEIDSKVIIIDKNFNTNRRNAKLFCTLESRYNSQNYRWVLRLNKNGYWRSCGINVNIDNFFFKCFY